MQKPAVSTLFLVTSEEKKHGQRHIDGQSERVVVSNEGIWWSPDAKLATGAQSKDGALDSEETKAHGGNHNEGFEALMGGHQQDHGESDQQNLADAHPLELRVQNVTLEKRNLHSMEKRDAKPDPQASQQERFGLHELFVDVGCK